jgi:hypothetical protein
VLDRVSGRDRGVEVAGSGCETELSEDWGLERGDEVTREKVRFGGVRMCCEVARGGVVGAGLRFVSAGGGVAGGCDVRNRGTFAPVGDVLTLVRAIKLDFFGLVGPSNRIVL